ncbi:hypothetical protein MKD33_05490, partial [Chromobacterium piscinae]
MLDGLPPLP